MRFCPPKPLFSGISSTKSGFLCAFALRNPRFQAFRAQNRGFCAFFGFGTPVFGLFEHKIGMFVRFLPPRPPFSGIPSTKSRFLCAFASKFLPDAAAVARSRALSAGSPAERQLFLTDFRFAPSPRSASLPGPPIHEDMVVHGLCGGVPDSAGNVSPWIATAAKNPPGTCHQRMHRGKPHCGNALLGTCHPRTHHPGTHR